MLRRISIALAAAAPSSLILVDVIYERYLSVVGFTDGKGDMHLRALCKSGWPSTREVASASRTPCASQPRLTPYKYAPFDFPALLKFVWDVAHKSHETAISFSLCSSFVDPYTEIHKKIIDKSEKSFYAACQSQQFICTPFEL